MGLAVLLAACRSGAEPLGEDPAHEAYGAMLRGRAHQLAGRLDAAAAEYERALRASDGAPRARLRLAEVLAARGEGDRAGAELFLAWMEADGALREPLFDAAAEAGLAELAALFARALPQITAERLEPVAVALAYRGAWDAFDATVSHPSDVLDRLAAWARAALARPGDDQVAVALLERLDASPRHRPQVARVLAELRLAQGRRDEALALWRAILRFHPEAGDVARAIAAYERLPGP